ncbi:MAG: hypothetical protein N2505_03880 [Endomicrobia bacterium]|nr:hypothetical protein [Endomicrobiia bacterium]
MNDIKGYHNLLSRLENLENQISLLEIKLKEFIKQIEFLKAENTRLNSDIKLLKEENKKLQNFYKEYLNLQSKTEIVKQKIKKLIDKISEAF